MTSAPLSEYRMTKWSVLLVMLVIAFAIYPSETDTFAVGDITVLSTSTDPERGLQVNFRVPGGESCPGIWIESDGFEHFISFARSIGDKSPVVDVPSVPLGGTGLFRIHISAAVPAVLTSGRAKLVQLGSMDSGVLLDLTFDAAGNGSPTPGSEP